MRATSPEKFGVMLLAAAALMLTAAAGATSAPSKGYATNVGYQRGLPYYHGQLKSPKPACLKNRTVTLYGKPAGQPDRAESSAKSDKGGHWQVPLPIQDTSDDKAIYFKVSKATRNGKLCRSGRTKDIAISGN